MIPFDPEASRSNFRIGRPAKHRPRPPLRPKALAWRQLGLPWRLQGPQGLQEPLRLEEWALHRHQPPRQAVVRLLRAVSALNGLTFNLNVPWGG